MLSLLVSLLAAAAPLVHAQDTCEAAPCQSLDEFAALALNGALNNETLLADVTANCGNFLATLQAVVLQNCQPDVEVAEGCACASGEGCGAAVNDLTDACKQSLVDTACDSAYWFEPEYGVNLRGLLLHLFNDCGTPATPYACAATVDPFDPTVCNATATAPGPAPVPAPVPAPEPAADPTATPMTPEDPSGSEAPTDAAPRSLLSSSVLAAFAGVVSVLLSVIL